MQIIYGKKFEELKEKINILLITAADCERDEVNNELTPLQEEEDILEYRNDEYEYFIGRFGKYNVVHVKTDEGNLGANSSLLTMYKTLSIWTNIKLAIVIGIACGKENGRQEIGDVLVSERVFYYEKCKMLERDNEIYFDKIIGDYLLKASRKLYQIFENNDRWNYELSYKENKKRKVQTHKGTIFSGEKIIASSKAQEIISKLNPGTGIGFDMEGAGIAYACSNLKFENWIIIKGISDFGKDTNIRDNNRKKAIRSVVSFCKYKFEQENIFSNILQNGDELECIDIDEVEKTKMISNVEVNKNYISRKIIQKSKMSFFYEDNETTLYDAITKHHNKIVLLSDAGAGKTEEAKKLVNDILENDKSYIAFYKNLNTYTDKKIVELIPQELNQIDLSNIIFVFDGFDEIANNNKKGFVKNLLEFCEDNPKSKIVVTCRRNFYESSGENYKGTLKGFEEYILTNITEKEIKENLLNNKIDLNAFYDEISKNNLEFLLDNLFYLNELISFFIKERKIPTKEILLDKIIEKSFTLDKNKYDTDSVKLRSLLENIALSLELLGRNYLSEEEYYDLIENENDRNLLQCSSIWQKKDDNNWRFKHNNFGEYLASQKIKKYKIDEIKKMVCYKNVDNKINPSWVNTLTFLVNNEKNQDLIKWILECMPEFFIHIEDGNIDLATKQKLFWNLFEQFKLKKMWLEYNIYKTDNLITSKEDIDRLLSEIKENFHYTSVGNALHIIKNVRNLYGKEKEIKDTLANISIDNNYTKYNKSIAIEILSERKLFSFDEFIQIVEKNKEIESSNLRKSYFYCCNTMNIVDESIDLLLDRFEIESSGMKASWSEDDSDNIYYWDEHKEYEKIFSNIKNKETIEIIIDFFESKKLYDREENYHILKNFITSIDKIYKESDQFVDICIKLYNSYEKDYNYKCMNYIIEAIKNRKLILNFFKKYMKNSINKSLLQYEKIIDDECIEYSYEEYLKGEYSDEETKYILRFSDKKLSNYNKLKKAYEEKTGDIIKENTVIDYDKIQVDSTKYFINKLFNKEDFIKFITEFEEEFKQKYDCTQILVKDLFEYKHSALTNENKKYYYLCNFLIMHLKEEEKINTDKIKNWNWDIVILGEVYEILKNKKDNQLLSMQQKECIIEICNKLLPEVNYREAIKYSDNNSFSVNWLSIYLHYFRYNFNIKYPEDILLDMLECDWQIDGEYVRINYIIDNVNPLKIRDRIIQNLNEMKIRSNVLINHIKYCIENDINDCMDSVGQYFLKDLDYFEERKVCTEYLLKYLDVEEFITKYVDSKEIPVQKEILSYISESEKEKIYKWILEKNEKCEEIEDKMFFAQQLIYINKKEGIEYYYNWAKNNMCSYESKISYNDINDAISRIDSIEMLDNLIELLSITLDKDFKDKSFNGLYNNLSKAIKNIGSKNSDSFIYTKSKLLELFDQKNKYEDIGKIQYLIEEIEYNYIGTLQNDESIDSIKSILDI